jgi:hypothetical protein
LQGSIPVAVRIAVLSLQLVLTLSFSDDTAYIAKEASSTTSGRIAFNVIRWHHTLPLRIPCRLTAGGQYGDGSQRHVGPSSVALRGTTSTPTTPPVLLRDTFVEEAINEGPVNSRSHTRDRFVQSHRRKQMPGDAVRSLSGCP